MAKARNSSAYIAIMIVQLEHIRPLKAGVVKVAFRVLALLVSFHGLMCITGIYDEEKYRPRWDKWALASNF